MKKVLVFWPRYLSSQKVFFETFLRVEGLVLVFVCKWDTVNPYQEEPNGYLNLKSERVIQWDFPHIRFTKLTISNVIRMMFDVQNIIASNNWDLIITSTQYPVHSKFAFLFSKIYKIRIAVYTEAWVFPSQASLPKKVYSFVNKAILLNSSYTLVQGKKKREVYSLYGVDEHRIRILPFLITDYMADNFALRDSRDGVKFLFLGRFVDLKGIDVLLEAFYNVAKSHNRVQLYLAGDHIDKLITISDRTTQIWEKICDEKLDSRVFVLGYIDAVQKVNIFNSVHFFIMPTKTNDGWGISLMDAISAGIPCIATDVVGASFDFIKHGENGYIVKADDSNALEDAMINFVNLNQEDYSRFSLNSREIFLEYNSPENMLAVVNEIAG